MSHELRTPLNAIIGFAELMHDGKVGPGSPDHREYRGDILTSSRHLLQLEVEDTGIGIWPDDMGRLFVEFQQLDASAAKKYQGTGLGLALTKRIVEAQGGRVGVRSTPGRGSVFFAVLPRVSRATPEAEAGARAGADRWPVRPF